MKKVSTVLSGRCLFHLNGLTLVSHIHTLWIDMLVKNLMWKTLKKCFRYADYPSKCTTNILTYYRNNVIKASDFILNFWLFSWMLCWALTDLVEHPARDLSYILLCFFPHSPVRYKVIICVVCLDFRDGSTRCPVLLEPQEMENIVVVSDLRNITDTLI